MDNKAIIDFKVIDVHEMFNEEDDVDDASVPDVESVVDDKLAVADESFVDVESVVDDELAVDVLTKKKKRRWLLKEEIYKLR